MVWGRGRTRARNRKSGRQQRRAGGKVGRTSEHEAHFRPVAITRRPTHHIQGVADGYIYGRHAARLLGEQLAASVALRTHHAAADGLGGGCEMVKGATTTVGVTCAQSQTRRLGRKHRARASGSFARGSPGRRVPDGEESGGGVGGGSGRAVAWSGRIFELPYGPTGCLPKSHGTL